MAKKGKSKNEIINDYRMLDKMSKQLKVHERILHDVVAKKIAKKSRTDLEEGLLENLDIVSMHMIKARKEIDRAKEKLKLI